MEKNAWDISIQLYNDRVKNDPDLVLDSLVDSVRFSLVSRLVTLKVNEGGFSLPVRDHTMQDLMSLRDIDRALLRENYRIAPYGIGNGCIVQSWFPLYDRKINISISESLISKEETREVLIQK